MKKLLVTSALPYANGAIHLGHLVEYLQTDIFVRYWRMRGRDVVYFCADDTHGTPIMIRARDEGIAPEALIQRMGEEHFRDFTAFQIQFDRYYSTHSEENRILSGQIFEALRDAGHITVRPIEQLYCETDKMFLPDRYVKGTCPNPKCNAEDQYGDACEVCSTTYDPRDLKDAYCSQCGSTPVVRESEHAFFRLGDFTERLREWLTSGTVPDEVANKLDEWFQSGLRDWDITRDAPYFGFEIPGRPRQFFYVWLDAPVGYMATTLNWCRANGQSFDAFWKEADNAEIYHFIGKDIVYFHALFWPAMLMGSGYRTPTKLCIHGFLTVNGEKMSKARGTFINASTYLQHLDPQYLRYYYASKLTPKVADIDLSIDDFINRVNSDLVGKLANIPSRVLAVLHKSRGGKLSRLDDEGRALIARVRAEAEGVGTLYEAREFAQVTQRLADMAGWVNAYLQEQAPWQTVKEHAERAAVACTVALNAYKILATLVQPILPAFGEKLARCLGLPALTWEALDETIEEREVLPYERLVDRLDKAKVQAMLDASRESLGGGEIQAPQMTLDPLIDCELQTMLVTNQAPISGSKKLVELTLEASGGARTVLAGIARDSGTPELLGKDVLILANLEPRPMMGKVSQGMLLAADVDGAPSPVEVSPSQRHASVE